MKEKFENSVSEQENHRNVFERRRANGRNLRAASRGARRPPPAALPRACADHMFASLGRLACAAAVQSLRLGHSPSSQLHLRPRRSLLHDQLSAPRDVKPPPPITAVRCAMELLCAERVSPSSSEGSRPTAASAVRAPAAARPDPVLLRRRVLDNLLRTEERYAITANYFGAVQTELTPHMRRLVTEWMLEVCEEQGCQEEVFPLATSYLDRFLSICTVGKSQVQLLATTCLLLASKLREPGVRGLSAEVLIFYTANSITLADLCSWELLVLSKLKWDVAGVTAHDFLPLLLSRLPLRGVVNVEMVQRHAQTFIALAARDYEFTLYSASTLASCSIAAALRGLDLDGNLPRLHELTRIDLDCLQTCLEQIEEMVKTMIAERGCAIPNGQQREAWTPPPMQGKTHSSAATPTDVRDVHF